jgi:aspartate/methionine/tyrosine aminotransferase
MLRIDDERPLNDPVRSDIAAMLPSGIGVISRQGIGRAGLIPLWFGESDLPTPAFIRDAAKRALDDGMTFYTPSRGVLKLREAIRDWHARCMQAAIDIERITVPGSAMLAVMLSVQSVVRTGDEVIVIAPIWPNIFQAVEVAGGITRFVWLKRDTHGPWKLDLDEVIDAMNARTKAVFFASPSNPTGWIMSAAEQRALLDACRARGIAIIADEVYGQIVFDGTLHASGRRRAYAPTFAHLAEPDDAVFIVNSFSKAWAMTGWRIGWLVHPRKHAEVFVTVSGATNTGSTSFVQAGAIAAIERGDEFVALQLERCRRNRAQLAEFVAAHQRLNWAEPPGGFYGYVAIDGVTDSLRFAETLLNTANVGVAPGMAFGPRGHADNERHVRICIAYDPDKFAEALGRLSGVL